MRNLSVQFIHKEKMSYVFKEKQKPVCEYCFRLGKTTFNCGCTKSNICALIKEDCVICGLFIADSLPVGMKPLERYLEQGNFCGAYITVCNKKKKTKKVDLRKFFERIR